MCSILVTSSQKGWTNPGKSARTEQQATSNLSRPGGLQFLRLSACARRRGRTRQHASLLSLQRNETPEHGWGSCSTAGKLLGLGNEGNNSSRVSWRAFLKTIPTLLAFWLPQSPFTRQDCMGLAPPAYQSKAWATAVCKSFSSHPRTWVLWVSFLVRAVGTKEADEF